MIDELPEKESKESSFISEEPITPVDEEKKVPEKANIK